MKSKTKALLAILFISIFTGANNPYIKYALQTVPPFTFIFTRFFLSFLIILPFFLRNKPGLIKNWRSLFYLSLLSTLNIILFVFGIRLTLASIGQVIYTFQPIVVIIISYFLLKEKITINKSIGILIGFFGVNMVVFLPILDKNIFNPQAVLGNFLIVIGCILFSLYITLSKKFLKNYSALTLTTVFIFTTTFVSMLAAFFEIPQFYNWVNLINPTLVLAVLYTVVVGTVLAYFLQQYANHHGSPLIASLTQYIAPGSTMIWSSFILGEKFNMLLIGGTIITLFGAWLVTRES